MRTSKLAGVLLLAVAGLAPAAPFAAADPAPSPAPAPAPAPPSGPKTVIDADGTYKVGVDIAPGLYRTEGGVDNIACYWKRTQGDQMLDNSLSKKPQVVRIEPTDTTFKTHRCQPWQLTECPPNCPPSDKPDLPSVLRGFLPQPGGPDKPPAADKPAAPDKPGG